MPNSEAKENHAKRASHLGILFIHGIGEQHRGETLTAFGAPLVRWMKRWCMGFQDNVTVEVRDSLLVIDPHDPDAPAHTWMHFFNGRGTIQERCLLAECCWAESFPVPNFRQVARWAIKILPWTAATQLAIKWRSLLTRHAGRIWAYPYIFAEGITYLGAFYLSALVQLLVVALLILAIIPIPKLRDFILNLQLRIAAIAGDTYVLLENPIKADAIVERVLRDIRWLANNNCDRIAIVAHSQGGAVVHRALQVSVTREPALTKVKLYFSLGSGLGKLHDLEGSQVSGRSRLWIGWVGVIALITTTILLPSLLFQMFTDPTFYQTLNPFALLLASLSFGAVVVVLAYFAGRSFRSRDNLKPTKAQKLCLGRPICQP